MNPTPDKQLFALGSCKWQLVTHLSSWLVGMFMYGYPLHDITAESQHKECP